MTGSSMPADGLYLITGEDPLALLLQKLEQALVSGKIRLLQYRRKTVTPEKQPHEIWQIQQLCHAAGVPLVINDSLQLAARFGLGVHLGQGDGPVAEARQLLGPDAIIGQTCHDRIELARAALEEGASYVAFGAVFPTRSKIVSSTLSPVQLGQIGHQLRAEYPGCKICAIGGITLASLSASGPETLDKSVLNYAAMIGAILNRPVKEIQSGLDAFNW